jgi:transposase
MKLQIKILENLICSCGDVTSCHGGPANLSLSGSIAPHLSREMQERIIVWHYELHKSPPEIAQLASCSVHTVYNVLSFHCDFDTVDNPFAQAHGRSHALDTGDMIYIASLLDAWPKMYLDELQSELALHRDINVSLTMISRALRRLAINHKKVAAE